VSVGTIKSVKLVGSRPVATMKIKNDFHLHEGATADVQLFSNAGAVNRTIELTQGDPTKPELKAGSTMQGAQTDQPVNFDDATEVVNPITRGNIKHFLIGLDAALKGRGKDFDRTLRHSSEAFSETANLLAQVNSDGEALKTIVRQGNKVTSALASSPHDLSEAADKTAALLAVTARRQAEISRSVESLGPALTRGGDALATLTTETPRLRTLLAGLGPVADSLGPFAKVLRPTLREAGPFLQETRKLVVQAPGNLRAFRPIVEATLKQTSGLEDSLTKVLPLGNALRAYVPDTLGFFQNLGSSLGTYDANGHMIDVTASLNQVPAQSSSATEIGSESCAAGHLKAPFIRLPGALECEPWTNYEDSYVGTEGGGG
jgi:ABC-type transporter Mla subunit MlaD